MSWPDGKKITAPQIAKLLKRQLAARSRNPIRIRSEPSRTWSP